MSQVAERLPEIFGTVRKDFYNVYRLREGDGMYEAQQQLLRQPLAAV
jgi:hypothetical protein